MTAALNITSWKIQVRNVQPLFLVLITYRVFFPSFCLKIFHLSISWRVFSTGNINIILAVILAYRRCWSIFPLVNATYFVVPFNMNCNLLCLRLFFIFFLTVALSVFFLSSFLLGFVELLKLHKWMYFIHFSQFYHYKLFCLSSPLIRLASFRVVWP